MPAAAVPLGLLQLVLLRRLPDEVPGRILVGHLDQGCAGELLALAGNAEAGRPLTEPRSDVLLEGDLFVLL